MEDISDSAFDSGLDLLYEFAYVGKCVAHAEEKCVIDVDWYCAVLCCIGVNGVGGCCHGGDGMCLAAVPSINQRTQHL